MELIYILACFAIALICLYFHVSWIYSYWEKRKIPCVPGLIPGLGHMWSVLTLKESFPTLCERIYKNYRNSSMIGFYQFRTPTLLLRDPDLAKSVLVTNFSCFKENQILLDPDLDPSMSKNPFFTTKENWKKVRAVITSGFSSRKLKCLFLSTREVSYKLKKYLDEGFDKTDKWEMELVDFWNKYTGEFVAHVGFGMEGHCFEREDNFEKMMSQMFGSSMLARAAEMISFYSPRLAKLLRIRRVPKRLESFFRKSVTDVLKARKDSDACYNDFLQIMIEYQKMQGDETLDEKALVVYMESFLLEAYESASISLSYLCLQLAIHPEIQERVRREINSALKKSNGDLCYEVLAELNYLEQALYESIRINATIPLLSKACTKECELLGNDGLSCKINPGVITLISLYGLHMDPQYWPNPEKFDPERFNEEENKKRSKFAFLPFGEGPRMCVGRRMAMIEMKLALIQLLTKCSLEISPKTDIPLKRDLHFSTTPKSGLWVYLKPLLNC